MNQKNIIEKKILDAMQCNSQLRNKNQSKQKTVYHSRCRAAQLQPVISDHYSVSHKQPLQVIPVQATYSAQRTGLYPLYPILQCTGCLKPPRF